VSVIGSLSLLPNLITLARLLAVPVTVYLLLESAYTAAFWVFVAAGLSDALDGYLAERLNAHSRIGAFLDPLADKTLIVGVFVTLGYIGHVPVWLVMLIAFRDLLIIGGALLFHTMTHSLKMAPLAISKLNTAAQIALAAVVLAELGLRLSVPYLSPALTYFVGATTFVSGAAYVVKWGRLAVTLEQDDQ